MLENVWTGEKLLLRLNLFSEVIDRLKLIHTVQQVAYVLHNFLFLIRKFHLCFQCLKRCIDPLVISDGAFVVIGVDVEECLGVFGQADRSH